MKKQFFNRKLVSYVWNYTFSSLNEEFLEQYNGSMDGLQTQPLFILIKNLLLIKN